MRPRANRASPRPIALAHYELGLVLAARTARLRAPSNPDVVGGDDGGSDDRGSGGGGSGGGGGGGGGGGLTPYGLVVRHYVHQLDRKFLELERLAHRLEPHALRLVLRLRIPHGSAPAPDPAILRDAIRWLRAMTTNARHRGAIDGRWRYVEGPVWARGFARQLLRTPTELARAVSACRRSSA